MTGDMALDSALETTGASAEGYELVKDAAIATAGVTAGGKVGMIAGKVGGRLKSSSILKSSSGQNKTSDKTNQSNNSSQSDESTHNELLNNISESRSKLSNYSEKFEEKNK